MYLVIDFTSLYEWSHYSVVKGILHSVRLANNPIHNAFCCIIALSAMQIRCGMLGGRGIEIRGLRERQTNT